MHKKITNTHLPKLLFISFSFVLLLSALFTTQAFAAKPCTLSYSMLADNTAVENGGTVTRTVTLKNTGRTTCNSVSYSVFYSPNETFVSSTPPPTASNYYWYVGQLNPNRQITATFTTRHLISAEGMEITTEGCAAATGAQDSCAVSVVAITGTNSVPVSAPVLPPLTSTPVPVATTIPTVPTTITTTKKEQGIWIWNFPSQMNTALAEQQLRDLSAKGFNTVYITIDDYLDIATLAEGPAKESSKAAYFATLSLFVTKANSLGFAVDAEGGWKDWAISANRWKGFALIDAAKAYNIAYPNAKLRGFQYDVEPYLLSTYETNKAAVLTEFVTFIDQSANRLVGSDLKFSMAIPHFYDSTQAWTPAVTYGGVTKHTFTHLLRIMEKTPGGTILLMSYRDFFEGSDGTRQIAEAEIKEASAGGYSTKVIVSQETGNVDPAYVTYYGSTKAVLFNALSQIHTAFNTYSNYGGTAVHYLDSYFDLR